MKTQYGINDPEAVKLWSRKLAREAFAATWFNKLTGTSDDSVIVIKEDLNKGAGDKMTCTLRMNMQGDGVQGDNTLEGNEEALDTFTDSLIIDQLRHATRSKGKMSEKRIPWSKRKEGKNALRDWWAVRKDRWIMNQLAGYTGDRYEERGEVNDGTDARYTGLQATIAPSSDAHFRADSANGLTQDQSDENLVAADTFKLTDLDDLVAVAETRSRLMRPVMWEGEKVWLMLIDPLQVRDLRKDAGANEWKDIQKAAMQGGQVKKNNIFTGALGMYNNVILHKFARCTRGVDSTDGTNIGTVRRAVLLGAQAGMCCHGGGTGKNGMSWKEELFDYGNQLGIKAGMIGGVKKSQYNGTDFGSIVYSTYAEPAV